MTPGLAFCTDFADSAIMFPLGIAVPIVLAVFGQRRAAIAWAIAIAGVWGVMLGLKMIGYIIAAAVPHSWFSTVHLLTPSGHVASSAAIYGGLIGLLLVRPGTLLQRSFLAAIAVAIGIGITRVLLGMHSVAEVLVAAPVGIAGAVAMALVARAGIDRRARFALLAVAGCIVIVQHGTHSSWEEPIREAALRFSQTWVARS